MSQYYKVISHHLSQSDAKQKSSFEEAFKKVVTIALNSHEISIENIDEWGSIIASKICRVIVSEQEIILNEYSVKTGRKLRGQRRHTIDLENTIFKIIANFKGVVPVSHIRNTLSQHGYHDISEPKLANHLYNMHRNRNIIKPVKKGFYTIVDKNTREG